jgi:predicted small lipoprotein YifL
MRVVASVLLAALLTGCGVVGPPIPPEEVGLAPLYTKAKKREAQQREEREAQAEAEQRGGPEEPSETETEAAERDILLPPLRPIGGR